MENDKIDFVIIWVDGNDPEWQIEKNKYLSNKNIDNRNVRYRDWENLKYWFRGVEKFAPWVNKIHFVTCGHLPNWLNKNNLKLDIVNHKDFIPEEYLPTFNSNTIELNLHKIKGLSEQFVYFNDDMFIVNPTGRKDFFINGFPCDSAILSPAIKENKFGIGNIELNNMAIINTYFNKNKQMKNRKKWFSLKYEFREKIKNYLLMFWNSFTGFYEFHICNSFLKSTFEEIWEKEFNDLNETCKNKFRNLKMDNNQWLFRDWQLASNQFIPRTTKFGKNYTLDNNSDIFNIFKNNKYKILCINDSEELSDENFERLKSELIQNLEAILPEKSSFEK